MEVKSRLTPQDLEALTPAELIIFEKHLSMGIDHLKKYLSPSEMGTLLLSGEANTNSNEQLSHDKIEIIGNLTLLLNSIFTAVFGAWMGMASFWGVSLGSYQVFIIVVLIAVGMGVFIAYHNYKYIRKRTALAINKQKINNLETLVLKQIYNKRQEEAEKNVEALNVYLRYLSNETDCKNDQSTQNGLDDWLVRFKKVWKEILNKYPQINEVFPNNMTEVQEKIENNLTSCFQEEAEEVIQKDTPEITKRHFLIEKLVSNLPKDTVPNQSWVKSNWRELTISFIPTVFGGFSSLFVYMGGGPNIAKALGHERLFAILSDPFNKVIEFILSIFMTGFLGFFFLHVNRQLIKRNQELEKNQKNITQMEGRLTIVDARLHKLKKAKHCMHRLVDIVKIMQTVPKENSVA